MTKLLLSSLCLSSLLWVSTATQAAVGTHTRNNTTVSMQRSEANPGSVAPARTPGLSWYLGVGCVSLFALKRLRRMGLERLQREGRLPPRPAGNTQP